MQIQQSYHLPIMKSEKEKTITEGNDTVIEILELHKNEVELLRNLRSRWRYGDIVIRMRDGLPFRLVRITEFLDLNEKQSS